MVAAKKYCAAKLCRSLSLMAMLWQSTSPAGGSLPELCQKILGVKELAKTLLESFLFFFFEVVCQRFAIISESDDY